MGNPTSTIYISVWPDKESDQARNDRVKLISSMAKATALYQNDKVFQSAVDTLITLDGSLILANDDVKTAVQVLLKARAARRAARNAWDRAYAVCTAQVEQRSLTAEDVKTYGFLTLEKSNEGLVLPSEIKVTYDPTTELVHVHVKYAGAGRHACAIEMCGNPPTAAGYQLLDGHGVKRDIKSPGTGIWWFRAATLRATEKSSFFGPVSLIIK